jgi:hypothetical protein
MGFPLRVNGSAAGKKSRSVRNRAALRKTYDEIFSPDVLEAIRKSEPADLFCRGQGHGDQPLRWVTEGGAAAKLDRFAGCRRGPLDLAALAG